MIFYDGGTNDAVTGPGGGVKAPKKWPDNFVNDRWNELIDDDLKNKEKRT